MKKYPRFDLKQYHFIFTEIGIICSLLFFIAATNINQKKAEKNTSHFTTDDHEIIIDLPPTIPPKKIPPQKPMIFTPKPNHTPIDDEIPEFLEFGSFDQIRDLPKPEPKEKKEIIVDFLEVMPTIIGGQEALYSKIKYPKIAQDVELEGKVVVQFIIDKRGNVTNPEIIRSVHPKLDEEVLRVIKLVKFSPGVQNGFLVKVKMVQIVHFKLKR